MNIFKPLFRRIAEENNEIPDIWIYDKLPQNVRVQIWRAFMKYYSYNEYSFYTLVSSITNYLCDEIGVNRLSYHNDKCEQLEHFFYNGFTELRDTELNFRYTLTALEIICKFLYQENEKKNFDKQLLMDIIDKINYRLREAKIGWTFNKDSTILIRIDNEATYQLAIKPAFQVLANKKFNETTSNFIKAYEAYQQGGYKNLESSVDYAIKTLESAIRNICKIKKYDFNENATLRPLIQVLIKNKYLPNYHDDYLNSIEKILLEGAVIRNKMTGHGKEEDKAKAVKVILNDDMVEFILSQVASCIVFLVKNL